MFKFLFLLFIVIPIIEIALLMQIGALIGVWPTIIVVIVTAWLGAKNVKQQGLSTLHALQTKIADGHAPSEEIVSGLMLLVAGILLVTPGFATDIFGLLLLVPAFRQKIALGLKNVMPVQQFSSSSHHSDYQHEQPINTNNVDQEIQSSSSQGKTLEGEFERKD